MKSSRLTPKNKICFLGLAAKKLENEIELLDVQIGSYDFQDPKQFLESLPPPKKEEIVIPFDLQIEEKYGYELDLVELESRFSLDEENEKDIQDQFVIKNLKGISINYVFYDPIADDMEEFYSPTFQLFFHYEKHIHILLPYHFRIQLAFGSSVVKGFKYQINSLTGFIGGFMSLESNMKIVVVRVGRSVCE